MTTRTGLARLAAGLVVLALATAVAPAASSAAPAAPVAPAAPQAPPSPAERAQMQRILETLRVQGSAPGAGITFGDGDGDVTLSAGTAQFLTNRPIRSTDKVRVGSDTKMFVASVVLQLVGEGRLDLDAPVDQYLPGVFRYPVDVAPADAAAWDGRTVTVRQLLQHTSGLADYADLLYVLNPVHQLRAPTPRNLVDVGLRKGPVFRPGTGWAYSNSGYALLGMVVEATTGRSLSAEIADRIVAPLGLTNTFFPRTGQRALPGSHVHGYLTALIPLDMSYMEPAVWGAAGALVSSPDDMNTFMSALLAGDVVPPALLAEMQDDVPYLAGGYGLGLVRIPLSCGDAWGHSGFLAGYQTFGLAMASGRHAFYTLNTSLALNLFPPSPPASTYDLIELALC